MRIVPKFALGGHSTLSYLLYDIVGPRQLSVDTDSSGGGGSSRSGNDGSLTEKDFFNMIKDINALPNERRDIVKRYIKVFLRRSITGEALYDLNSEFLMALDAMKEANDNRKAYDDALGIATSNGALNEPAITPEGYLMILNEDGGIGYVDPYEYMENKDDYNLLTVSLLMNMRAYESFLIDDQLCFNIAKNSVGFESFDALLDKTMERLGSTLTAKDTRQVLDPAQTQEQMRELADQGIDYFTLKSALIDQTSTSQIDNLLNYILAAMPKNMRIWASLKTNIENPDEALKYLAFNYISAGANEVHKTTEYEDPKKGNSGSGSGDGKQLVDYWTLAMKGWSGDTNNNYTIGFGNGAFDIGKAQYLNSIPGLKSGSLSLSDFISESKIGIMMKGQVNLGDYQLLPKSYDLVLIRSGAGMYIVDLPIDIDGYVDFGILQDYVDARREVIQAIELGQLDKCQEIISNHHAVSRHWDFTKNDWDWSTFGTFAVLNATTYGDVNVRTVQFDVASNKFITAPMSLSDAGVDKDTTLFEKINNPSDADLLDIRAGLKNDKIKKGSGLYNTLIFIRLNNSEVNTALADGTSLTRDLAFNSAKAALEWNATHGKGIVNGGSFDDADNKSNIPYFNR